MAGNARIEVHILTGFLGSGKTTLLNAMLGAAAFADTAVVVNELGEIGLDHLLVTEQAGRIALLEGGCLCCAVLDSLPETLLELCRKRSSGEVPAFSRMAIETTGLADPGPVEQMIRRSPLLAHFLAPGVVVTALDMLTAASLPMRHPEALRQLVLADRIALTKLDLREPLSPAERVQLRALNPLAEIVTAGELQAQPARLMAPVAAARAVPDEIAPAHHTHWVRAWSLPVDGVVTRAGLAAFAAALEHQLGPALLRCKGVVHTAAGVVLVQGVGSRFSFTNADARAGSVSPHLTCIVEQRDRADIEALIPWLHVPEGTLPPSREEIA